MSNRRRAKDSGLLFVYDRVCTQDEKEREMSREYGVGVSADNPSREQSPSRPLVTEEKNRAQAIPRRKKRPMTDTAWFGDRYSTRTDTWTVGKASAPSGSDSGSGEGARARAAAFSREDGGVYTYRPGAPEGGEAVKEKRSRRRRGGKRSGR